MNVYIKIVLKIYIFCELDIVHYTPNIFRVRWGNWDSINQNRCILTSEFLNENL